MKKRILYGLVSTGVLLLAGCNETWNPGVGAEGSIMPIVDLDTNTVSSRSGKQAARSNAGEITAEDLHLKLTSTINGSVREWGSVNDFNADEKFNVGSYSFEASYGNKTDEGFDCPYYYGVTAVSVRENETTQVSLTASLGNAMLSLKYTDAFAGYFTDYSVDIKTSSGNAVTYSHNETRPAYIVPGPVQLVVNVVKPNGQSGTYQALTFNAEARHHYNVTLNVNEGNVGKTELVISFDDTMDSDDVIIDLSEDLENVPVPTVRAEGFTSGAPVDVVAGSEADNSLMFIASARGGIASAILETNSTALIEKGWPATVDLIATPAATKSTMTSLGFKETGVWQNPDKMGVVDLSGVIPFIRYIEGVANESTFTLTVTDRISQQSEPVTLTINTEKLAIEITGAETLRYYDNTATFDLDYNGTDAINRIGVQYMNLAGGWNDLKIQSITAKSRALSSYVVTATGLPDDAVLGEKDVILRTVAKNAKGELVQTSGEYTIVRVKVPFSFSVSENNVFALRATGIMTHDSESIAEFANRAKLEMSTDGGINYSEYAYTVDGDHVKIEGLKSSTTYMARIKADGMNCRPVTFTTEAELQIPNGGFEDWSTEKKGDYQYLWLLGGGAWNTLNALTCSQSGSGSGSGFNTGGCAYKATSGTIPANSRNTTSMDGGGILGTSKSGDGNTVGDANLHNDKQHSGSNAALIRTIGWGSNNKASASASGQHFGTCDNKTPGELFLGSIDGTNPVYGAAFASRPTSLSFFYHYDVVTAGNGDYGTVEVKVLAADGTEIFSATQRLTEVANYSEVIIPFSYNIDAKAAKLSLIFKSSANSDIYTSQSTSNWRCPGVKNVSGGEYIGSELYIDDITLNY